MQISKLGTPSPRGRSQFEVEAGTPLRAETETRRWALSKIFRYFYNTARLRLRKRPKLNLRQLLRVGAGLFFVTLVVIWTTGGLKVLTNNASSGQIQLTTRNRYEPVDTSDPLKFLQYWKRTGGGLSVESFEKKFPQKPLPSDRKYVTFEDDTGGWNNIRMAFEVFVLVAKVTGRILVVPPPCRFYLLDRGPVQTFEKSHGTVSTYADYYDLEDLRKSVTIITTEQFLKLEAEALRTPENIMESALHATPVGNGHHTDYFLWLRSTPDTTIYPTGPIPLDSFFKMDRQLLDRKLLHFPMHISKNYRYLSGVPRLLGVAKPNSDFQAAVIAFLRSRLHYKFVIWEAASRVIELLGGVGKYSALHIRRNDLQYKDVFIGAEKSCSNVSPQLRHGEVLYLATDETAPDFFKAFNNNYTVHTLRSITKQHPEIFKFVGSVQKLHKLEGMIEQAICAAGRRFFGTPSSTYSSYIFRLRGYMFGESEESVCRFHTSANYKVEPPSMDCNTAFSRDASLWKL